MTIWGKGDGEWLAVSFESCGTLGTVPAFLSLCALSAKGALAQSPLPRLVGKVACVQCAPGAWSHVGSVPGEGAGGGALVCTAHGDVGASTDPSQAEESSCCLSLCPHVLHSKFPVKVGLSLLPHGLVLLTGLPSCDFSPPLPSLPASSFCPVGLKAWFLGVLPRRRWL